MSQINPSTKLEPLYRITNTAAALLSIENAAATVRTIETLDRCDLDHDGRTHALAGVIAEHAQRFPNRTEAMARLVEIATQLTMGNGR